MQKNEGYTGRLNNIWGRLLLDAAFIDIYACWSSDIIFLSSSRRCHFYYRTCNELDRYVVIVHILYGEINLLKIKQLKMI